MKKIKLTTALVSPKSSGPPKPAPGGCLITPTGILLAATGILDSTSGFVSS